MCRKVVFVLSILLVLSLIRTQLFSALPFNNLNEFEIKDEKSLLQEIRKDNMFFQQNLRFLLSKYNYSTSEAEKGKAKEEIRKLVLYQTEREVRNNKTFLKMQVEKIKAMQEQISEIERNMKKYVEERTVFFIEQSQNQGNQGNDEQGGAVIRTINVRIQ
jgi:hypothetical protein